MLESLLALEILVVLDVAEDIFIFSNAGFVIYINA
jgi:hypothetical protein